MTEVELELTYLVKQLPADLKKSPSKTVIDIYFPAHAEHALLRLRRSGDQYEMTKKQPIDEADLSHQHEHTIKLTEHEFKALAQAPGKRVAKQRYYYPYQGRTAEIDIFLDDLQGLVLADFEFTDRDDQLAFTMPDFCLADVTQEEAIAGGTLAGKTFAQVAPALQKYSYKILHNMI